MTDKDLIATYSAADDFHVDGLRAVAARARAEALEEAATACEGQRRIVRDIEAELDLGDECTRCAATIRARAAECGPPNNTNPDRSSR